MIENYKSLPNNQKEITSNMQHVFCGLHALHNLGIYSEKAILEWEKVVEEEGSFHGGFKNTNSGIHIAYNFLLIIRQSGKAD